MKIEMQPKFNVYRKTAAEAPSQAGTAKPAAGAKLDVVDFSHGATVADKAMVGMKASIHSYLETPAGEARLESLRASVKNGTYRVDTADLVDSILERIV